MRRGDVIAAVAQGRADTVATLAHRRIGKSNGGEVVLGGADAGDIDLHLDDVGVDPIDSGAKRLEKHKACALTLAGVVAREYDVAHKDT